MNPAQGAGLDPRSTGPEAYRPPFISCLVNKLKICFFRIEVISDDILMVRGTWPEKKMRKNIITDYAASVDNLLGDVKKDAALVLPVLILDEQGNIKGEFTSGIGINVE